LSQRVENIFICSSAQLEQMLVAVANVTRWMGECGRGGNEPVVLDFETTL
jgi:hypothetical protein